MSFKSAYSTHPDPVQAAKELASKLPTHNAKLLIFFASPSFAPAALGQALKAEFGSIPSLGCTTSGEIAEGRMLMHSIVAGVFDGELLEAAAVALASDMTSEASVGGALAELAGRFGSTPRDLDPRELIGVALHDGLGAHEEGVMATLGAVTNVPFVGGSAGDNLAFEATYVFKDFVPARKASVLALVKPKVKFKIVKTQSFDVLPVTLKATRSDNRTVHTFNEKPAAEEYARALGVGAEALPSQFQASPLGLVIPGGEPYVRSPRSVEGTSVNFYCSMKQGAVLSILRSRDIVQDTRRDFTQAVQELGSLSAALNFHCILRTLELQDRGQLEAYGQLFDATPTIGFSTYGESYIGHINQTSSMLLFA